MGEEGRKGTEQLHLRRMKRIMVMAAENTAYPEQGCDEEDEMVVV